MNSKQESLQYSAALAITRVIKGTSSSKLHKKFGLESLKLRKTFRRPCSSDNITSTGHPTYLFNLIPKSTHGCQKRFSCKIPTYECRTDTFMHFFFPWIFATWNQIHPETWNASVGVFMKHLLYEIRPVPHAVYNTYNYNGLKLVTWLRLGLSHLNEHRFDHIFENFIDPLCTCRLSQYLTSSRAAITMTLSDI